MNHNPQLKEQIAKTFLKVFLPVTIALFGVAILSDVIPVVRPGRLAVDLISLLGLIPAFILKLRNKTTWAISVIFIFLSLAIFIGVFLNGGVMSPAYVGSLVLLIFFSWFSSIKATVLFLCGIITIGAVAVLLAHTNHLPAYTQPAPLYYWVNYSLFYIAAGYILNVGIKLLYKTLNSSLEKEELLSSIFSSMNDAIIVLNKENNIIQINDKTEELSHILKEYYTTSLLDIVVECHPCNEISLRELVHRNSNRLNNTLASVGKGEEKRWLSISLSPLSVCNVDTGHVLLLRDVSEQIKQERQLHHVQKMDAVGHLASGIAHDFNNMISAISGSVELLFDDATQEQEPLLKVIETASEKAASLTKELLIFSRKPADSFEVIDTHKVIDDAIFILNRTIDKEITLSKELSAEVCTVRGDDNQLQNALMNMGINASHVMPDGGTITFRTRNRSVDTIYCDQSPFSLEPGEFIEITIEDTGLGMSQEVMSRIFEPFFTTKIEGKGTGLGLAAVYSLVKKSQGEISVESEPGQGSRFTILLPTTSEKSQLPESNTQSIIEGTGTILVAEDEEILQVTIEKMLRSLGYEVILVSNGTEALQVLNKQSVDLILLDQIMPKMGGRKTLSKIRKRGIATPVILSSGLYKDEDMSNSKELDISGFIFKPYQRSRISQLIAEVLNPQS